MHENSLSVVNRYTRYPITTQITEPEKVIVGSNSTRKTRCAWIELLSCARSIARFIVRMAIVAVTWKTQHVGDKETCNQAKGICCDHADRNEFDELIRGNEQCQHSADERGGEKDRPQAELPVFNA